MVPVTWNLHIYSIYKGVYQPDQTHMSMPEFQFQSVAIAVIAVVFFLVRYLNQTDIPKIKNLPEVPGVPIFGNLIQLGDEHARRAREWVKKYGPVFQVRLGNKVKRRLKDSPAPLQG